MAQNRGPEPRLGKEGIHRWQGLGMGHQSPSRVRRGSPGRATWCRVLESQQGEGSGQWFPLMQASEHRWSEESICIGAEAVMGSGLHQVD